MANLSTDENNVNEILIQFCNLSVSLAKVTLNKYDAGVVLAIITSVISAVVNIGVIVVIASTKELQRRQNIFTCSLALSDGIFALSSLATLIALGDQTTFVQVMFSVSDISISVSLCTIGSIALERFIIIVWRPFERKKISTKTILILCIFNWILIIAITVPGYVGNYRAEMYLTTPSFITGIIVFIVILYIAIYWSVRQHEPKTNSFRSKREKFNSDRLLVTFSLILGIFVVCWLPYCIVIILSNMSFEYCDEALTVSYMIGFELILINSLSNPFIYLWRIKKFRNASCRLFSCGKRTFF
ncbi:adrenocorticotropic hormone receptor-like [Anneissia japonica]|uniref:adrenocorticotropic hormone receptor-like n=1 Tax=Anneissia japonica TaxID=1529436 RepID=UPI001425B75B|nr:adrenocorticotropic hormone receptor-like [Anneissia japonica]